MAMVQPATAAHPSLPVIDMEALFGSDRAARAGVARAIEAACRDSGFFYLVGHRIPDATLARLDAESRAFFALPEAAKMRIAMARGGRAWRGYFPVGGELTSGRPDLKEGLYLGTELPADHPRVRDGWPLHGANLWPNEVPGLRRAALDYMAAATRAAHALMEGVALSLGLEDGYFARHYTAEPTVLFRIFHYPAPPARAEEARWGVGEHTDYGLLTLLAQDANGGLAVNTPRHGWIEAPPLEGALVCNIGDMLDRLTGGRYRSTPHRVLNTSGRDRLSFPLFFDPDFAAEIRPLPEHATDASLVDEDRRRRWDGASVHAFEGTYGDYLMGKVAKVFPELGGAVLTGREGRGR
jgi:isopenicillin N synthase-like dioxygenase